MVPTSHGQARRRRPTPSTTGPTPSPSASCSPSSVPLRPTGRGPRPPRTRRSQEHRIPRPAWPHTTGTTLAPCTRRPPGTPTGARGTVPAQTAVEVAGHGLVGQLLPEAIPPLEPLLPRPLHPLVEGVEKTPECRLPGVPWPADATGAQYVPPEAGSGRDAGGSRRWTIHRRGEESGSQPRRPESDDHSGQANSRTSQPALRSTRPLWESPPSVALLNNGGEGSPSPGIGTWAGSRRR
jgi:hypothetical protein